MKNSTSDISERLRIARDLHDSLAQEITAIGYFCDAAIALSAMGRDRQALVDIRARLSHLGVNLRDEIALLRDDQRSLFTLLSGYLDQIASQSSITITQNLSANILGNGSELIDLPNGANAVEIFRIAKEVISNILAHANAKNLSVMTSSKDDSLVLVISDDGISLSDGQLPSSGYHFGRVGLHERAVHSGGSIEFNREGSINHCRITIPQNQV